MKVLRASAMSLFMIAMFSLAACGEELPESASDKPEPPSNLEPFLFTGDAFEATFLQPTLRHQEWDSQDWKQQLENIKKLGITEVIVQWTRFEGVEFISATGDSLVSKILQAAKSTNTDIYLGLSLSKLWSSPDAWSVQTVQKELRENRELAERILRQAGDHPRFRGWYVPHEITDVYYDENQQELLLRFLRGITTYLNDVDPQRLVLASGYTLPAQSHLLQFAVWWGRVFDEAGIDVLIFQDGAGVGGNDDWQKIHPYLEGIAYLQENMFAGELWFVVEVFSQVDGRPVNDRPFRAESAAFARVEEQLQLLQPLGKKLVAYAYWPYMQKEAGEGATRLFDDYTDHLRQVIKQNSDPANLR